MSLNKETILKVISDITEYFQTSEHRGQLTVTVPKDKIIEVGKALKENENTKFNHLVDITAIDWMREENRFEVVYNMNSLDFNSKLFISGDLEQFDRHKDKTQTGLWDALKKFQNLDDVGTFEFKPEDVVRNPLISKILKRYEE